MASGHDNHATHSGAPYLIVWAALLALTGISYAVSQADLGSIAFFIAMIIASTKATMVALIFMHLKGERFTPKLVLGVALSFIALMISLMIGDVKTRYTFPEGVGRYPKNLSHTAGAHGGEAHGEAPSHGEASPK
jgi:cytochrome c oxidase subunit IV